VTQNSTATASIAENEPISSLPLSTYSAIEKLHDSVLYRSIIDTDIDMVELHANDPYMATRALLVWRSSSPPSSSPYSSAATALIGLKTAHQE